MGNDITKACNAMSFVESLTDAQRQTVITDAKLWHQLEATLQKGFEAIEAEDKKALAEAKAREKEEKQALLKGLTGEAKPVKQRVCRKAMPSVDEKTLLQRVSAVQAANGRLAEAGLGEGKLSPKDLSTMAGIMGGKLPPCQTVSEFKMLTARLYGRQVSPLMPLVFGMSMAQVMAFAARNS